MKSKHLLRYAVPAILLGILLVYQNCTGSGFSIQSIISADSKSGTSTSAPNSQSNSGIGGNSNSGPSGSPSTGPAQSGGSTHSPTGITGNFTNLIDATFGNSRPDATVKTRNDLDQQAYYWFIYNSANTDPVSVYQGAAPNNCKGPAGDGTDGLYANFRSRYVHCDPGSAWDRHVISADRLSLKASCGLTDNNTGNCADGNIGGGMLRFIPALRPTATNPVVIEMQAILPKGMYSWPAFWLNPGQQAPRNADGSPGAVLSTGWPPEIDIFDQFGWDGAVPGTYLIAGTPTNGDTTSYASALCGSAKECDLPLTAAGPAPFQSTVTPSILTTSWGITYAVPKDDLTASWHTYGAVIYTDHVDLLLDGVIYRKLGYTWPASSPPMHLILSNQTGAKFNNLSAISDQGGVANGWTWDISYVRVWTKN